MVIAPEPVTVYDLVGGQPFFDALVERFYVEVGATPQLRALYPDDLGPGKRALSMFLAQYWGGPAEYSAAKGHPRLRMRHAPFAIDEAARDAWLSCMAAAVDASDAPAVAKDAFHEYFVMAAAAMVNTA